MRLLVSVDGASEARTALLAGADIVDAKNPRRGALGAVTPRVLRSIVAAVHLQRPVSAALGDATQATDVRRRVSDAAVAGAAFVKLGFRRVASGTRALRLAVAAQGACRTQPGTALVLVAYADATRADSLSPFTLVEIASRCGAYGVLLDTAVKNAGGLFEVLAVDTVIAWVAAAHAAGLHAGLAGGLATRDVATVRRTGADLVGVRGAACEGGRGGRVSATRVSRLRAALGAAPALV